MRPTSPRWLTNMRLLLLLLVLCARTAFADGLTGTFPSIDGGTLALEDWRGQPVLVVNTASQCGYTYQYEGMQSLYDRYRNKGLIVLAIPSDDFNQELNSAADVKDFCMITFGLDLPMTDITHVKGNRAHPFFKSVKDRISFVPQWNFNKILIGPDGEIMGTWRSNTPPESPEIVDLIETTLD